MLRGRLFAALLVIVAIVSAAAVVVVARGGAPTVTREAFLQQVNATCTKYGKRLDAIPPPGDLSSPGSVYESLNAALPVLKEQEDAVRALDSPPELQDELDELYALTDRSLVELEAARDAAGERELFMMATALTRFEEVRDEAKVISRRIGFDC